MYICFCNIVSVCCHAQKLPAFATLMETRYHQLGWHVRLDFQLNTVIGVSCSRATSKKVYLVNARREREFLKSCFYIYIYIQYTGYSVYTHTHSHNTVVIPGAQSSTAHLVHVHTLFDRATFSAFFRIDKKLFSLFLFFSFFLFFLFLSKLLIVFPKNGGNLHFARTDR